MEDARYSDNGTSKRYRVMSAESYIEQSQIEAILCGRIPAGPAALAEQTVQAVLTSQMLLKWMQATGAGQLCQERVIWREEPCPPSQRQ